MPVVRVVPAGTTNPFGYERTVTQAFPSAIPSSESDPFLMCDNYAFVSDGVASHPDEFPIAWHPHRGFDILSYLKEGVGRHGDSLGHRETFATPGMQWMSVGSGIEHAEGGATPKGETRKGFQIWVNVPGARKMDDPRYGTEPPEAIPQEEIAPGVQLRLLAGEHGGRTGRFQTVQPVYMVDLELEVGSRLVHSIPKGLDTCMVYVYEGEGTITGNFIGTKHIALFDATTDQQRQFELVSTAKGRMAAMVFAGKKIEEAIAWHGPIVMNTQTEIQQAFHELQTGAFPPVRVPWDYKKIAARPRAAL